MGHFYFRAHATPDFIAALSHTALAGVTLAYSHEQIAVGSQPILWPANVGFTQATTTPGAGTSFPTNAFYMVLKGTLWIHTGLTSDLYATWGQATSSATLATTLHRGSFIRAVPLILF